MFMMLNIGTVVKRCRTEQGMTQEGLATLLSVTPQTVSRWESGTSYPDITLLPALANLFGVTVDELIGMDTMRREHDLRRIFTEAIDAERAGDYDRAAEILRDALAVYPGHDGLMSELAMALGRTGRTSDRTEAIALSERVLALSDNDKVRSTTKSHLCYLYREAGMTEKAAELCRSLPHIWESREMVAALLAEEDDGEAFAQVQNIAKQVLTDLEKQGTIAFSAGYRYP